MDDTRIGLAVVIERTAAPNRWEDWKFRLVAVVPDPMSPAAPSLQTVEAGQVDQAPAAQLVATNGPHTQWLYAGLRLELFPDECKGYFLNLTSGNPGWFVSWVVAENDPSQIEITGVSVSYIEADRRMFAEERVETVPLPSELCEWLRLFTNQHFRPDSARKVRAASFLNPDVRERVLGEGRGLGNADGIVSGTVPGTVPGSVPGAGAFNG